MCWLSKGRPATCRKALGLRDSRVWPRERITTSLHTSPPHLPTKRAKRKAGPRDPVTIYETHRLCEVPATRMTNAYPIPRLVTPSSPIATPRSPLISLIGDRDLHPPRWPSPRPTIPVTAQIGGPTQESRSVHEALNIAPVLNRDPSGSWANPFFMII